MSDISTAKNIKITIGGKRVLFCGSFVAKGSEDVMFYPWGDAGRFVLFRVKIIDGDKSYTEISQGDIGYLVHISRPWNDGAPHAVVDEVVVSGRADKLIFNYSISFIGEVNNFAYNLSCTLLAMDETKS